MTENILNLCVCENCDWCSTSVSDEQWFILGVKSILHPRKKSVDERSLSEVSLMLYEISNIHLVFIS